MRVCVSMYVCECVCVCVCVCVVMKEDDAADLHCTDKGAGAAVCIVRRKRRGSFLCAGHVTVTVHDDE